MSRRRIVWLARFSFVLLGSLSWSTPALAAGYRTVALSGQTAPGLGSVGFTSFDYPTDYPGQIHTKIMSLNNSGQAAFHAYLSDGRTGIWSEGSGQGLDLLALSGTQPPQSPAGTTFSGLNSGLVLNDQGVTSFTASFLPQPSGANYPPGGVWSGRTRDTLRVVARSGAPTPGVEDRVFPVDFVYGGLLTPGGQSVFFLYDQIQTTRAYAETVDGGIRTLIDPTNPAVNYYGFEGIGGINEHGEFAFTALGPGLSHATPDDPERRVWSEGGGLGLRRVTASGMPAPGAAGQFLCGSGVRQINRHGQSLISAGLCPGAYDRGLYRETSPGVLELIATSTAGVVHDPEGEFYQVNYGTIDGHGRVAFASTRVLPDQSSYPGIWTSEPDGGLQLLARRGDPAPGAADGWVFQSLGAPQYNTAGWLVFQGHAQDPNQLGTAVGAREGIWVASPTGELQKVVAAGDRIEVAPGALREVQNVDWYFHESNNQDGRASHFNDLAQVLFFAHFTDGSEGLFVSDPLFTPSPGDMNLDGMVDREDVRMVLEHYGAVAGHGAPGDLTHDGRIDLADLRMMQQHLSAAASAPVPEPGTLALWLASTAAWGCWRRRKH